MSVPIHLYDRFQPPPGMFGLVREEMPYQYQGLVLVPESYRSRKMSAIAKIEFKGEGISETWPLDIGDRVILEPTVGRRVVFGSGSDQKVVYLCRPVQVVCKLVDVVDVEDIGEYLLGRYKTHHDIFDVVAAGLAEEGVVG